MSNTYPSYIPVTHALHTYAGQGTAKIAIVHAVGNVVLGTCLNVLWLCWSGRQLLDTLLHPWVCVSGAVAS